MQMPDTAPQPASATLPGIGFGSDELRAWAIIRTHLRRRMQHVIHCRGFRAIRPRV